LYIGLNSKDERLRHIYRTKNSLKIFCSVFLVFWLLASLGMWRGIARGVNTWFDLTIGLVFLLAGGGFAAQTFTSRVVLADDSISYGSIFQSHSLRLDEIRCRSEYVEYQNGADGGINVDYLELIPNDHGAEPLKIPKDGFDFDQAFWQRILRIPDLEDLKTAATPRNIR
jgi:hypothetical protein